MSGIGEGGPSADRSRAVVVGTAGHIDHGKSTLVRALTGIDPDRLAEEKRRGITIDLGFAHATVDGRELAFVDVPGHERFVHNMLAGATGIDLLLLVVAADESIMPQTREHLAICRLLGLETGVVAVTRIDVAGAELTELVVDEVRDLVRGTFLEKAPIVPVSGVTEEGLDTLRAALLEAAECAPEPDHGPWPRLPIDRVFSVHGFGTVVTGTLHGGALREGDELHVEPGGIGGRVRGLQVHGEEVKEAPPGRRVAVNLQGLSKGELRRGMVLTPRTLGLATRVFDAEAEMVDDAPVALQHGDRVRVHHMTAEVLGRVRLPQGGSLAPGERGALEIRLEEPLSILPGDPFVLRRYSPLATLGGGRVADVDPPRWRGQDARFAPRTASLAQLPVTAGGERLRIAISEGGPDGVPLAERALALGLPPGDAEERARSALADDLSRGEVVECAGRYVAREGARAMLDRVDACLAAHHAAQPLAPGMPLEELRAAAAPRWSGESLRALVDLSGEERVVGVRDAVHLASHDPAPRGAAAEALASILHALAEAELGVPTAAELLAAAGGPARGGELLDYAASSGEAVRLAGDRWISPRVLDRIVGTLEDEAAAGRTTVGVPEFKALFGLTRKGAIPLLEKLDDLGVTRRAGETRVIAPGRAWGGGVEDQRS